VGVLVVAAVVVMMITATAASLSGGDETAGYENISKIRSQSEILFPSFTVVLYCHKIVLWR
jgi:ABC-type cobalt transport system substrate-binding protein